MTLPTGMGISEEKVNLTKIHTLKICKREKKKTQTLISAFKCQYCCWYLNFKTVPQKFEYLLSSTVARAKYLIKLGPKL